MDLVSLLSIIVFLGGILYAIKKGFNELIKGLQSIDSRLKKIEDKLDKEK
jgi:phage-related protein